MINSEEEIEKLKSELAIAKERIKILDQTVSKFHEDDADDFEDFYLAFENQYRGSIEEIENKLKPYLSILLELVPDKTGLVVDLGCGRGEWLKILSENGYDNLCGVDKNLKISQPALDLGFNIQRSDVFDALSKVENDSCAAITSYHFIEHIPFSKVRRFFKETYRCLVPGGIAIVETPNPRNLFVGSNLFHFDPTHVRPIPIELSTFCAKYAGFEILEAIFANLHPGIANDEEKINSLPKLYKMGIEVGLDYGLIIRKPNF